MAKELVYFDSNRYQDWMKSVSATIGKANTLIDKWHKIQKWHKVKTRDEAIALIDDPAARLDAELLKNVNTGAFGSMTPNLDRLAELINIDRKSWQVSCQSYDTIDLDTFLRVEKYTEFEHGRFRIVPEAFEPKKDSYSVYAENEKEQANYKHLQDLVTILNDHLKRGFISTSNMAVVCSAMELLYADNKVFLNDLKTAQLIKQL